MQLELNVALVVDDLFVRKNLLSILSAQFPALKFRCFEWGSAVSEIGRAKPSLVVIEDQARARDGLALTSEILKTYDPKVVLVAQNDMRAAKAFEVGVSDYLSLPLRPERVSTAFRRALRDAPPVRRAGFSDAAHDHAQPRLRVKSKGGFIFLRASEIVWISAAGNYLDLYCVDRTHRIRETLSEFHARLDGAKFLRIHRSIIVNTDYIDELRSWGLGDYVVVLHNSKELPVSRNCRGIVDNWMRRDELLAERSGARRSQDQSRIEEHPRGFRPLRETNFREIDGGTTSPPQPKGHPEHLN